MTRSRAADDFDAIHQRIEELRRETAGGSAIEPHQSTRAEAPLSEGERRFRDRREGLPPPWVPTIFLKKPTNREIARRFWHTRSGW